MIDQIRKLAIVGASARAAAFSAIRAGYEVVAADLFADADLARVAAVTRVDDYPMGLLNWLEAADCDAWIYTGALENHPHLVTVGGALLPLCGNDGPWMERVRDPLVLQRAALDAGLLLPETRADATGLPLDGSWLCKTYRGSSGSGVWRHDGDPARQRAVREQAVYQKVIGGTPAAAAFVIGEGGARLLGLTLQIVGGGTNHPWRYVGSIGPLDRTAEVDAQLAMLGDMLHRRFELRGVVGVDLVLADGRVWVVEVNPRYSASMEILERATGVSAIGAHVAACDPEGAAPTQPRTADERIHGKTILFATREATVTLAFFAWAIAHSTLDAERCLLADIPAAGEVIPAARPVLTAFAAGDSVGECEERLAAWVAEIQTRLYGE
jgi:predicted ATP-grasp superfamily ATP-dependent carboligase